MSDGSVIDSVWMKIGPLVGVIVGYVIGVVHVFLKERKHNKSHLRYLRDEIFSSGLVDDLDVKFEDRVVALRKFFHRCSHAKKRNLDFYTRWLADIKKLRSIRELGTNNSVEFSADLEKVDW